MNKLFIIFLLIILGLVIFALGGGLGIMFQTQKTATQIQETSVQLSKTQQKTDSLGKELSSNVIPLHAIGSVTKIDGMNITLNSNGDTVVIPISSTALIFSYGSSASGVAQAPAQSTQFQDIKIGDYLSINLKVLSDNTLEGETVSVINYNAGKSNKSSK